GAGAAPDPAPRAGPPLRPARRPGRGRAAALVLVRTGRFWRPTAASGTALPQRPEEASLAVDLGPDAVLALRGPALTEQDTRLLGPYVTQLRLARERERLAAQAAAAETLAHTDALHTALLEAVGQDLRAPLAALRREAADLPGPPGRRIAAEVRRMERLVADLLDLDRLRAGEQPVLLRPTALAPVLAAALAALPALPASPAEQSGEQRDEQRDVRLALPDGLPPVLADAGLLERALAVVLAGAGTPALVDAGAVAGRIHLRVRAPGPAADGTGLTVARGFVEAMNGELTVEPSPAGGTAYTLDLARAPA
ncbi:sensor histidine kinase, partial [Kitasatospora sp. NPDC059803]|uniref:sensor histidine kinase n=1 Tax=Kitasatospora sp. NPDC059803 TaxID=3346953 RepID=UPI003651EAC9